MDHKSLEKMKQVIHTYRRDVPRFAERALTITTKGGDIVPFEFTSAQRYMNEQCEDQLKRKGFVRKIIVKPRQIRCSTFVTARFYNKVLLNSGTKCYVIAHLGDATAELFTHMRNYHANIPAWMQPEIGQNNHNRLSYVKTRSSIKLASAESGNSGRGGTYQLFHGSEVAFWKDGEAIVEGALQQVPLLPGTEVILESTTVGPVGWFYNAALRAQQGKGDYELIFIPWWLETTFARDDSPEDWQLTDEEQEYSKRWNLTRLQMWWRHQKIEEYHGSVQRFRRDYPATFEEAFSADVEGALWRRINITHVDPSSMPEMKRMVIGVDPATTARKESDETGIVLAGLGVDDRIYVIRDVSGRYNVEDWAAQVIDLYQTYNVGKIVAETNQGGDMVINAIRARDRTANVMGKHVSVSKVKRHEPVSALYRSGSVVHVGNLTTLEDQMCTWNPITHPKESPDRVDALTLAIAELGLSAPKTLVFR